MIPDVTPSGVFYLPPTGWLTSFYNPPFLKRPKIYKMNKMSCTDALNEGILFVIPRYLELLQQYKTNTINDRCRRFLPYVRYRVKRNATTFKKLQAKSLLEKENGSYNIGKVVNDLMGFRIILSNVNENKGKIELILKNYKDKGTISRYYYREDNGYRAFHCYFKESNKAFPWELQIWDAKDEYQNNNLHSKHEKQREIILEKGGR
jgi:hypothetical protein